MVEVVDDVIVVDVTEEVIEVVIGEGVMPPEWGTITGELADQRDLQAALDEKADADDLGALALKDDADWDEDIVNKPPVFPPAAHDHDDRYYTEAETDALLAGKQDGLTFDNEPTAGSSNPVKSSGIKSGLDGKVAKLGDEITGRLTFIMPGADSGAGSIPANAANYMQWKGPNGKALSALGSEENTEGLVRTLLLARHYTTGSSYVDNSIYLSVASNGDQKVQVSTPAGWRSALGVYAKDEVDSALDGKADVIVCDAAGSDAEFSDGAAAPAAALTAGVEPVQDLHGYGHPWMAGCGKNLLTPHAVGSFSSRGITFTYNSDGTVTANGTATGEITADIQINLPSGKYKFNGGPLTGQCDIYCWNSTDSTRVRKWDGTTASDSSRNSDTLQEILIDDTKNNSLRCRLFNTAVANNFVFKPMIVSETETDTSFEPYANVCPITGWTGCNITRTGKNLADVFAYGDTTYVSNGITWRRNDDGSFTVTGTASANSYRGLFYSWLPINNTFLKGLGGKTVTISGGNDTVKILLAYRKDSSSPETGTGWVTSGTLTLPADETYTVYLSFRVASGVTVNTTVYPQVELGTVATAYEPYNGTTYSVSFGSAGTVYGGSLNVKTGVLTVDRASYTVNENTEMGYFVPSTTYGSYVQITVSNLYFNANEATVMSSSCKSVSQADRLIDTGIDRCFTDGGNYIALRASKNSGITTKEALKAHFMGTQLVYKLASAVTYQLTGAEVMILLGKNRIMADTGPVALRYRADTKLYIDGKFAELQALILEN